jgi:nucleotide-binding universal stress UspA family protein
MDIPRSTPDSTAPDAPRRILVAVHGHEPAGWETQVRLALASWPLASVQVLGTVDTPTSTFTGLIPAGRRAHAAATRAWRRLEEERVCRQLDALLGLLSAATLVTRIRARRGDPGRAIAGFAATWDADLVVVGPDERPWLERRLLGAIHERVVAHARCGVLIIPVTKPAARPGTGRGHIPAGPAPFGEHRPLAAGGEA